MGARRMNFDKHRWAHPISHIETGCVLMGNEKLGGVFHQTVILIVNHNEQTGTTGVCINRPLPGDLVQVASETMSNIDQNLKMTFNEASVSYGGPVMEADYSVLHGYGEVEGSKKVAPGVFVGGSRELMGCLEEKNVKQSEVLFVKGHAAWIPSQIERRCLKVYGTLLQLVQILFYDMQVLQCVLGMMFMTCGQIFSLVWVVTMLKSQEDMVEGET